MLFGVSSHDDTAVQNDPGIASPLSRHIKNRKRKNMIIPTL